MSDPAGTPRRARRRSQPPTVASSPVRRAGDLQFVEHRLPVPIDHDRPDRGSIEVFAREVTSVANIGRELPHLVWFQGGPGHPADRPTASSGWLKRALQEFRVILFDQRGTGLSSPVSRVSVEGRAPGEIAALLANFRADAIVEDAELLRAALGIERWSTLGQSYGGFITTTYLSRHPGSLRSSFITAGLPSIEGDPDVVYRQTYAQTAKRNVAFFEEYAGLEEQSQRIAEHLASTDERLPTGERLTPERFRALGIRLGGETGYRALPFLLESAFVRTGSGIRLGDAFLVGAGQILSYGAAPLYAVMHESIYTDGPATRWSAERVRAEFPEFALDSTGPFRFTGETVHPWLFEQDPALVPFAEAARLLAERDGWPSLWDAQALAANDVPVAAAVYHDDMFVPRESSLRTAEGIRGIRLDITNHYQHDGIRHDGPALLSRLLDLVR